jgi:hypothetical protein
MILFKTMIEIIPNLRQDLHILILNDKNKVG